MFESQSEAPRVRRSAPPKWRPIATIALIALNAGVFALQWLWGATESTAMLASMGAMVSSRISDGEWWRLASCTVLHGGPVHLAVNSFVLYIIGSFVERVLGTGRFLVLYVCAGVIASIGSFFWTQSVSVGASGAVFGLLAAQGVIAYFPRGLLPPSIIPAARRAATTNLLLNLGISFMPNIDLAAHFTGAAAGAGLVYFGLVTPKVTTPPRLQWVLMRRWFQAGVLTAVTYGAVALFGVTAGKPWKHSAEITFTARTVPVLGQQRQLPTFLPEGRELDGGAAVFGDIFEPYVLFAKFQRKGSEADGGTEFHKQIRAELSRSPDATGKAKTTSVRGNQVTCAGQTIRGGIQVDTCVFVERPYVITLEGAYRRGTEERFKDLTLDIAARWWSP